MSDELVNVTDARLRTIAEELSGEITPSRLAQTFNILKEWGENIADLTEFARQKILTAVTSGGTTVSDKGTKRVVIEGWQFEVRPKNTGIDSKKLEARLRAKHVEPVVAMDATLTYKVNADKLQSCIGRGILTADDIKACEYEVSYAVQRPKQVKEE